MAKRENKVWYYWWSSEDKKWYILAFCNKSPSCSRRQFQVTTGELLGKAECKPGEFQDAFEKDFQSAHYRLKVDYPANWPEKIPPAFLSGLWEKIIPFVVELPPSQQ
jgi:hypothetical protein